MWSAPEAGSASRPACPSAASERDPLPEAGARPSGVHGPAHNGIALENSEQLARESLPMFQELSDHEAAHVAVCCRGSAGLYSLEAYGRQVVTGGGRFIGGHLVRRLLEEGYGPVRAVDYAPVEEWHQVLDGAENLVFDLRLAEGCYRAVSDASVVYNLAADMGGIGFIEANKARCMLSVLIDTHLLEASREQGVERYFFSSSACVYAQDKQTSADVRPLREEDAISS
jgi:hypothetical protein